ncbi:unnamed protein product [Urochloa decumbens]|uniref:RING-type E3 ubiquitin transferase n=1 Tax=Urochloa decumbens TaxID=240449 RepID=A0ABC8Z0P1_9POAL
MEDEKLRIVYCFVLSSGLLPAAAPMEDGDRRSGKKARVLPPHGFRMKQEVPPGEVAEEEMPEEASGGRALMATSEVMVRIDILKDMLHCPLCTLPLKPPIFQCEVGHMACSGCVGQLPTNQCHSCDGGAYAPRPAMDALFANAMVPCPHEAHGCRASVAYYQAAAHGRACPHQPCPCAEPGCAFAGSPPALLAHLAAPPHSWPVDEVRNGETLRLRVPEHEARRLLLAAAEDGGGSPAAFVISVGDRGARVVPVTVACVRAPGAAAAGPQYTCKMWVTAATGKVESVLVNMEVPSAASAGAAAAGGDGDNEEASFLPVPRKLLRGAARQMLLSIRIDKASG